MPTSVPRASLFAPPSPLLSFPRSLPSAWCVCMATQGVSITDCARVQSPGYLCSCKCTCLHIPHIKDYLAFVIGERPAIESTDGGPLGLFNPRTPFKAGASLTVTVGCVLKKILR